jgi:DoxX-like family
MFIAYVVVAIVAALILTFSALLKLRSDPRVVASIHETLGIPMSWFTFLAGCELAGAVGLLVGIAVGPLGVAAAIGVVAYLVCAIGAHLRVGDVAGLSSPVVPLLVGVVALVTRLLSL